MRVFKYEAERSVYNTVYNAGELTDQHTTTLTYRYINSGY